jgi:multicomponent Na+:H+ antiporter subunit D
VIVENLPALQVVLPLISAPLIVLVRRRRFAWLLTVLVSWVSLAIAIAMYLRVGETGAISYAIGSWQPPWGIEYRVDALSAFVLVLVSLTAAVVAPYAKVSIAAELPREQEYLFFAMFCLCLAGLLGITITGDMFNVFVFLEISSLSTYVMIALGQRRKALVAAYQYLVMGTIGATLYVIGVGLLYLIAGTLNIADITAEIQGVKEIRPLLAAFAFITVGVGLKLALFPLHQWLPNAYTYAPSVVTAFLSATATKVSVYVLLRFYFTIFGTSLLFEGLPTDEVLLMLSVAGIVTASLVAVFQQDLKRMFAYSSVAQIGYIVLGLSFDSVTGLTATIVHLVNHAVSKGGIFLLLGGVMASMGSVTLARVRGMGRVMPLTSFGIVLCGLSLIGVPGTAGFISKWYLVLAALEKGQWWLVFLIVLSSLLAVVYVWRFVEAAYLKPTRADVPDEREAPPALLIPAFLMVGATLYFGFDTSLTVGAASQAAAALLGAAR